MNPVSPQNRLFDTVQSALPDIPPELIRIALEYSQIYNAIIVSNRVSKQFAVYHPERDAWSVVNTHLQNHTQYKADVLKGYYGRIIKTTFKDKPTFITRYCDVVTAACMNRAEPIPHFLPDTDSTNVVQAMTVGEWRYNIQVLNVGVIVGTNIRTGVSVRVMTFHPCNCNPISSYHDHLVTHCQNNGFIIIPHDELGAALPHPPTLQLSHPPYVTEDSSNIVVLPNIDGGTDLYLLTHRTLWLHDPTTNTWMERPDSPIWIDTCCLWPNSLSD